MQKTIKFTERKNMLTSLGLVLLIGITLGTFSKKVKLPALLGMLITGIILGPNALNLLDQSILNISADLRTIALVIILTRAGLSLDLEILKKVGRPAILMCFVPACFEILGMVILAPLFLNISRLDAALMGAIVAAVSPAVIIPKMLYMIENKYGEKKGIAQLIMAGASVDDVFVIVIFSALLTLSQGHDFSGISLLQIPSSIILGIAIGIAIGLALIKFFKKFHMRDTLKIVIIISLSFLLLAFEHYIKNTIMISALLSIMSIGATIECKYHILAERLASKYSKLWVAAEVWLFVLVGAEVNITYALNAGAVAVVLILCVLIFRVMGVYLATAKTQLNFKEQVFCMISYMPKATVQAAIGGIPLMMGLPSGEIILTVAVLSILITAPLGATLIDATHKKLLVKG